MSVIPPKNQSIKPNGYSSLYLAFIFLVIGGFSSFIEALLPVFKLQFHLNYTSLTLFDACFFLTYGALAIILAAFFERMKTVSILQLGLIILAIGCLTWFVLISQPQSSFSLYLTATFIIAIGVVILFIAAELLGLYLTGTRKTNRLSLFQSAHGIGAFVAPLVLTPLIYNSPHVIPHSIHHINHIGGLFLMGVFIMLALAILIIKCPFPKYLTALAQHPSPQNTPMHQNKQSIQQLLGWFALFLYVGVEITIGSFIINQGMDHYHIQPSLAGHCLAAYWLLLIMGRLIGGYIIRPSTEIGLLGGCALIAIILVLLSMSTHMSWGIVTLTCVGLFNSIMFPILYSLGLARHRDHSLKSSGIMASALSGGAFIPLMTGYVADSTSLSASLMVCAASYFLIVAYSIYHAFKK